MDEFPALSGRQNPRSTPGYAEISARHTAASATLANTVIRPDNNMKGELPIIEDKPSKFIDTKHEIRTEISFHKRKLIMRVEIDDFIPHIKNFSESMSEDYILKNPVTYSNRVTAIKHKIYNATGIPPHQLDILRISISTKRVKLCWVSFGCERTVNEIFRLSMVNGNARELNAFPHIPAKAMCRKEGIEKNLKRIQAINTPLRYQVRMGESDLVVKIKYNFKDDYRPYRSINLADIDPNNSVPDWDLVMSKKKDSPANATPSNPFDWQKKGKRGASSSPENRVTKRRNREEIDDWQIAEFVHAFLEGTATRPKYQNLDWQSESATDLMENGSEYPAARAAVPEQSPAAQAAVTGRPPVAQAAEQPQDGAV